MGSFPAVDARDVIGRRLLQGAHLHHEHQLKVWPRQEPLCIRLGDRGSRECSIHLGYLGRGLLENRAVLFRAFIKLSNIKIGYADHNSVDGLGRPVGLDDKPAGRTNGT